MVAGVPGLTLWAHTQVDPAKLKHAIAASCPSCCNLVFVLGDPRVFMGVMQQAGIIRGWMR